MPDKIKKFDQFFSQRPRFFYGNPTFYQKSLMSGPDPLLALYNSSGLKEKDFNTPYPDVTASRKEIFHMIEDQKLIHDTSDPYHMSLDFIQRVEDDHAGVWCEWMESHGMTPNKTQVEKFMNSTDAILYTIKYHYQRPRPFQFAYEEQIEFYPLLSSDADSPAYPSGHAIDAYKMAYAIGKKVPPLKHEAKEFSDKTAYTRIVAGLHYPSDVKFSQQVFKGLVTAGIIDKAIEMFPF